MHAIATRDADIIERLTNGACRRPDEHWTPPRRIPRSTHTHRGCAPPP